MSKHPIVHVEIPSKDAKKNSQFYADLFDWKMTVFEQLNYVIFDSGESSPGGGFPPVADFNKTDRLLIYVDTDDIERDLKKAVALGGKSVLPKTEIPGQGWFALFTDPEGNTLALYTSANPS